MTHESDGRVTDVVQQGGGKLALVGRKPERPVPASCAPPVDIAEA
jgi:hypothetical protein